MSSWYIIIRIFDCVDACKEDCSLIKTIPFPYTSQTTIREGVVLIRLESLFEIPSIIGMKKGFAVFGCANNQHIRDMGQELVCLYFDKGFYPSKYILDGHPQQQASILFFLGAPDCRLKSEWKCKFRLPQVHYQLIRCLFLIKCNTYICNKTKRISKWHQFSQWGFTTSSDVWRSKK